MAKKKSTGATRHVVVATPKHTLVVEKLSVAQSPMKGKEMPEKVQQDTKADGATYNKDAAKVEEAKSELAEVVKTEVVKVEVVDKKAAEVTYKTPINETDEQKVGGSNKTSSDTNTNTNKFATLETEHYLANIGDNHSNPEPYVVTATYALTTDKLTDPIMKEICATIETCASNSPPPSPPKAHATLPYAPVVNTNDLLAHLTTIATQVSSVLNQSKISGTNAPIDAELKKYLVRTNLLFYQIQRANGKSMADINLDLGHTSLTVNLVKELRENTLGCHCIFDCAKPTETPAREPTVVQVAVQRPALGLRGRPGNLSEEEKTAPAASALVNLANIALMTEATPVEKPKYSFHNPDPDDPLPPDFEKKAWKTARKQRQKANKKGKADSADSDMADEEERVAEVVRAVKARVEADIAATVKVAGGAPTKAAVAVRGPFTAAGNAGAPVKAPIQTMGPVTGSGSFNKAPVAAPGSINKAPVTGTGNFNQGPFTGPGNFHKTPVAGPGNFHKAPVTGPGNFNNFTSPGNFNKAPVTVPGNSAFGKSFPGHPTLNKAHGTIPSNLVPTTKAPLLTKGPLTASANSATVTKAPASASGPVTGPVVKTPVSTTAPTGPPKPVSKTLSYADLARSAINSTPAAAPVAKLVPLKPSGHPSLPAKPSFPMPYPMFPPFGNNIKPPNNVAIPGNIVDSRIAEPIVANVTAPGNTVNAPIASSAEKAKNPRFYRDAEAEEARKKARRARVKEREREGRAQRREAMARLLGEVKAGVGGVAEPSGVAATSNVGV